MLFNAHCTPILWLSALVFDVSVLLGDRPTDRPTYNTTRSVRIGTVEKPNSVIVAVDSTDRINFSSQQLYSAVRL